MPTTGRRDLHVIFSRWPIRNKLQLGLGLLAATILTLFGSAYYGLYAYRGLVKSLSARATELPLADQMRDCLAETHEILSKVEDKQRYDEIATGELATSSAADQTVWDADDILRLKCKNQFDLFSNSTGLSSIPIGCTRIRASVTTRMSAIRWRKSTIF